MKKLLFILLSILTISNVYSQEMYNYSNVPSINTTSGDGIMLSISKDANGTLWCGTQNAVYTLVGSTWSLASSTGRTSKIVCYNTNNTIITATSIGIYEYVNGSISTINTYTKYNSIFPDDNNAKVNDVIIDQSNGWVYIATDGGIWKHLIGTTSFTKIVTKSNLKCIELYNGNIWVGDNIGLYEYTTSGILYSSYDDSNTPIFNSLSSGTTAINDIVKHSNGNLYFVGNFGLFNYNTSNGISHLVMDSYFTSFNHIFNYNDTIYLSFDYGYGDLFRISDISNYTNYDVIMESGFAIEINDITVLSNGDIWLASGAGPKTSNNTYSINTGNGLYTNGRFIKLSQHSTSINGNILSVNSVSGATYQWYLGNLTTPINGETNNSYTASSDSKYIIETTVNGSKFYSFINYSSTTTGIMNKKTDQNLIVYPNPSNGNFNISWDKEVKSIQIYNSFGQEVPKDDLNEGIYTLVVNNMYTTRLVIK